MYAIHPQSDSRAISFLGLSAFLHFAAFAFIVVMKIAQPEIKPVIVEIEILPPQGKQIITPLIQQNLKPQPQLPQPVVKTETPRVKKTNIAKLKMPAKLPKAAVRASRVAKMARMDVPVRPLAAAPNLNTPTIVEADDLSEDVLNEDFERVDRETSKKVSFAAAAMEKTHRQTLQAEEDSLSEVKLQAMQEATHLAALAKARRSHELAAAQQNADAQAASDAKAAIAREAAEAASALAAAKAAAAERASEAKAAKAASEAAESMANNQGTAGSQTSVKNGIKFGIPSGVRALEDLKQRPGNQRPRYDYDDRLNGRQGEIIFVAYISKEGSPTQFKMMKSSGHRELDMKTLKSLKAWRFFPGQEGWVEIPFKWDLKGGPQEMPATLRRKASNN